MERAEMTDVLDMNLKIKKYFEKDQFNVEKEIIDMRSLINRFKKRDFKLWQLMEIFDKGWSFSGSPSFFINGKTLM